MNVRWSAVLLGWLVDFCLSLLVQFFAGSTFITLSQQPDLTRTADLVLLGLLLLSTGVGGYVAGRLARESQVLNGLMVGIIGILISAFLNGNSGMPRIFVFSQLLACMLGALGGYLSQFPRVRVKK